MGWRTALFVFGLAKLVLARFTRLRLVSYRDGRGSILITTNKGEAEWPALFAGDVIPAPAILDRSVHGAHAVALSARTAFWIDFPFNHHPQLLIVANAAAQVGWNEGAAQVAVRRLESPSFTHCPESVESHAREIVIDEFEVALVELSERV